MQIKFLLGLFLALALWTGCCKDKKAEDCACPAPEICVNGACELPEGTIRLGDRIYDGDNTYYGVLPDRFCVDTIVFTVADNRDNCGLYTKDVPNAIYGLAPVLIEDVSADSFSVGHALPYCVENGKELYSTIGCKLFEPNSLQMNIRFFYNDTTEIIYFDSTLLTMIKI